MTVSANHTATTAPSIPRPRTAMPIAPVAPAPDETVPQLPAPQYPWPEPWRSFRGAQPRTEFWNAATASWHSRGPLRRPRKG